MAMWNLHTVIRLYWETQETFIKLFAVAALQLQTSHSNTLTSVCFSCSSYLSVLTCNTSYERESN